MHECFFSFYVTLHNGILAEILGLCLIHLSDPYCQEAVSAVDIEVIQFGGKIIHL